MEININCDLGEKSKHHSNKNDPNLLEIVNSANVACGYHAGDNESMKQVVQISKKNGVSIGAHPSFKDPENFGRRRMNLSSNEVRELIISFDLNKTSFKKIKNYIENIDLEDSQNINSKKLEIPVCCHENFSMDIKRLEEILKLSREKILENFLNKEYFCYMTGFIAGMPFLGDLDENMRAQRLETPRVKVPKGSVALTEQFANIYTFESPGGWNILGNTPLDVFDSSKEDKPNLINPGDTVIIKEITLDQYKDYNEQ